MTDAVARLTPLGLMLLALLREDDMHPYEMIKLLRLRRDDRLITITTGSAYHTVTRLVELGLAQEVGVDREGNRPERTTYTITDAGTAALNDWVRVELARVDRPERFRIALAESHNLERDEVVDLLTTHRAAQRERLIDLEQGRGSAVDKLVPAIFLIEIERDLCLRRAEIAWLDDVLVRITDGTLSWDTPEKNSDRYLAQRKAARS